MLTRQNLNISLQDLTKRLRALKIGCGCCCNLIASDKVLFVPRELLLHESDEANILSPEKLRRRLITCFHDLLVLVTAFAPALEKSGNLCVYEQVSTSLHNSFAWEAAAVDLAFFVSLSRLLLISGCAFLGCGLDSSPR